MPRRLLITAGPTHEPIDAVRYLANRSSGTLGVALAEAGREAGWDVTLLLGPCDVALPTGVDTRRFTTTADLDRLLAEHFTGCDLLIMAAAVADYRPAHVSEAKLPRRGENLVLELEPTPDLVARYAALKKPRQRVIGFALEEPGKLIDRAEDKLATKRLDAIVANPLATMGAGEIDATLITAAGRRLRPGTMSKPQFARWLIGWLSTPSVTV